MKKAIKSLATLLGFLGILVCQPTFCYTQSKNVDIKILQDVGDSLIIDPLDSIDAYKGKKVIWYIDTSTNNKASNVKSFKISLKNGTYDPFDAKGKPPSSKTRKGIAKIKF